MSSRGALASRTRGPSSAAASIGSLSAVVPTYSEGNRRPVYGRGGGHHGGYYGGYYGGSWKRHYGYYGCYGYPYTRWSWGWGWGSGWGWGVSIGWGAPYWSGYVGFGYPYYGYSSYGYPYYGWRVRYAWRYPYDVYYPYYRSVVYVSYPYDYVSYYYDPPYYTYYSDGDYVVEGGAEAHASDEASTVADSGSGVGVAREVIRPRAEPPTPVGADSGGSSELLSQMKPAQFNFAMGFLHFDEGEYKKANEYFYVASLEDPDSDIIKLFLGVSLFSIGEYHYSAEYLRLAMSEWKAFLLYDWDLRTLYRQPGDFDAQKKLLEEEVRLHASDRDARLVLAFVQYHAGDLDASGRNWDALEDLNGGDPLEAELARRYVVALNVRRGLEGAGKLVDDGGMPADVAVARFLSEPSVADVPSLPIR